MPIPPEAIEKVEGMAGDGNMDVTFTYQNITYSTADLELPQASEENDEAEMEE